MQAFRCKAVVEPGGVIEILSPELPPAGTEAEVVVLFESAPRSDSSMASLFGTGKGCFKTPEEADLFLSQERNRWGL